MGTKIHFSELNEAHLLTLMNRLQQTAIDYAEEINMSGLSEGNSHDIYVAIQNCIREEHERAVRYREDFGERMSE